MESKDFLHALASVHLKRRFILTSVNSNLLPTDVFTIIFFLLLFLKPGNADPRSSKLNTWLSRIMASGCSFASRAAPGGRRSGRHVKHMPSGWAQLPTVCCCHVGKLSLGASPGENAHRFSALGDTYHNLLLAGQSFLLTCVAHPPQGGTTNLTGFQSWSLCAQRHQRTWVIPITSSITSS